MFESLAGSVFAKWGLALAVAAFAWLAPAGPLLGLVGVLLMADTVTGILAARAKGEALTSRRLSRLVWKALAYQCAIISGLALEGIVPGVLPLAKLCATAIAVVEAKSLAENVKAVTGVDLSSVISKLSQQKRD